MGCLGHKIWIWHTQWNHVCARLGATPATIAVIDGVLKIGLSATDLTQLAQTKMPPNYHGRIWRFVWRKKDWSNHCCRHNDCREFCWHFGFATGGIGGVHRGAEHSFDISADLRELALTPITVVAAGAKQYWTFPKRWRYWKPMAFRSFVIVAMYSLPFGLRGRPILRLCAWMRRNK